MEKIWILVADSANARILATTARTAMPTEVKRLDHPEGRLKESELVTDQPGRSRENRGQGHAMQESSATEHEEMLFAGEIVRVLSEQIGPLDPLPNDDPTAPAVDYAFADGIGRIGFIASVSQPFCASCNRFRLTADGKLRNCLFSLEETDVRALLRSGSGDEAIAEAMRQSVAAKWEGHQINSATFVQPDRPMYSIGG